MKPSSSSSSILRGLSLSLVRLSASSAVTTLPATTSFDHQLTFHSQNDNNWLLQALDASTTTQQITLQSLSNVTYQHSDRKIIDYYLDFNVKMLDTCNELTDKIHAIQHYVEYSLKVVLHLLQAGGNNVELPHPTSLARARELLDSCQAMETRRCNSKQSSALKRFFSQKLYHQGGHQSESKLDEILSGSKAVTSMVCEILATALSFKSKCGLPILAQTARSVSSWSSSLQQLQKHIKEHTKSGSSMMLVELHQTMEAARNLRVQLKSRNLSNLRNDVEELKRRCEELEEGIIPFESKVKELYKRLISVRMALLEVLSHL